MIDIVGPTPSGWQDLVCHPFSGFDGGYSFVAVSLQRIEYEEGIHL